MPGVAIPIPLQRLLSDATMAYAFHDFNKSRELLLEVSTHAFHAGEDVFCCILQMCMLMFTLLCTYNEQVVRQAPSLPHPYHTLGLMYEEQGLIDQALKLYLMAAQEIAISDVLMQLILVAALC